MEAQVPVISVKIQPSRAIIVEFLRGIDILVWVWPSWNTHVRRRAKGRCERVCVCDYVYMWGVEYCGLKHGPGLESRLCHVRLLFLGKFLNFFHVALAPSSL